jgi:SAM-dependent methyltransferase/putative flippase GtrA
MSCEVNPYAFDDLAAGYDATFTNTVIGRALREIVWQHIDQSFAGCRRVLELGCGTGEDAVRLARAGAQVLATDASERMIQAARQKALLAGCSHRINFQHVAMEDLETVLSGETFDAVLSNFGAVNCARDLPGLTRDVASRLAPGGKLLWVVLGRTVPWEWAWYLARGKWSKAWRRLTPGGVIWRGLTVTYPAPRAMKWLLEPCFTTDRVSPLGLVLPPSYAARWLERSPRAFALLRALEEVAQHFPPLACMSDHYIIEATRTAAAARASPHTVTAARRSEEHELQGSAAGLPARGGGARIAPALITYATAHARELVRFVVVGSSLALLNLFLLYLFREALRLPDPIAVTLMYLLGALAHFVSHRRITYGLEGRPPRAQVIRYLLMLLWNFALLQAVVSVTMRASLSPYIAVIAVTGLTLLSNFLLMTHAVFTRTQRP